MLIRYRKGNWMGTFDGDTKQDLVVYVEDPEGVVFEALTSLAITMRWGWGHLSWKLVGMKKSQLSIRIPDNNFPDEIKETMSRMIVGKNNELQSQFQLICDKNKELKENKELIEAQKKVIDSQSKVIEDTKPKQYYIEKANRNLNPVEAWQHLDTGVTIKTDRLTRCGYEADIYVIKQIIGIIKQDVPNGCWLVADQNGNFTAYSQLAFERLYEKVEG